MLEALDAQVVTDLQSKLERLSREIGKVLVGYEQLIEECIIALLSGGHVLIEGAPGLGKTRLVKTIGQAIELSQSRIQFTPDLMPADVVGTNVLMSDETGFGERQIRFSPGPIFAHLVLADEINRATPKTQSALLEAMQEQSVTVAGATHRLEQPFFVMATQNPIEMEGTYPLPEAQVDRFFFKLLVHPPSPEAMLKIVQRTTGAQEPTVHIVLSREELLFAQRIVREVPIAEHVARLAVDLVHATHPDSPLAGDLVKRYVAYGSSPRGAQTLVLAGKARALLQGRFNVSTDDIVRLVPPALRHRVILNFEAEAEGVGPDTVVQSILSGPVASVSA